MEIVTYPAPHSPKDTRDIDIVELLQLILDETTSEYGPVKLVPSPLKPRYKVSSLERGDLSTMWTTVNNERENKFISVKIPIRKGLLGYRIFLIRDEDQEKFSQVQSVADLRAFTVGQGPWEDVHVLEASGFKVSVGQNYEGLFRMLSKGRFDFFSRGINEAPGEYNNRKKLYPNMRVEQHLLLYYPWPKFFYFNKKDQKLASRVYSGFLAILNNGRYDTWFSKHYTELIRSVRLKERRLIKINNPLLPATVPLDNEMFWFSPRK